MEQGRRFRRFGMVRGRALNRPRDVLPLSNPSEFSDITRTRLSYTISCWYCDLQVLAFAEPIFRFGRRNARYLRAWFSIGVGFGVTLIFVLAVFLLWELAGFLQFHESGMELSKLVFGFSPTLSSLTISLADAGYILWSTLISVSVHEFGHIVAAASEGVQVEYLAVFIAVMFPGALVAFNHESLQALQRISALRIYCAGIWHNAMVGLQSLCKIYIAICGSVLFHMSCSYLVNSILKSQSPFILTNIHLLAVLCNLWINIVATAMDFVSFVHIWSRLYGSGSTIFLSFAWIFVFRRCTCGFRWHTGKAGSKKGYCIPRVLLEENEIVRHVDNVPTCPDDLTAFISTPCSYIGTTDYNILGEGSASTEVHTCCLNAKEVIKLKKCGDGWSHIVGSGSNCICSQDESCFTPINVQGSTWVEITYISLHYSPECSQIEPAKLANSWTSVITETNCSGSFVYVGDIFSLSNSVHLTSYRPRFWPFGIGAYVPNIVEKILSLTYHVSLTLALLNTLPVFFLDGESILEVELSYCPWSTHRKKQLLRLILAAGTLISGLSFVRMVARSY